MAILLYRPYQGYAAAQVVELPASTEAALIAQNLAVASTPGFFTTGAITANTMRGSAAIPAGSSSVVVTNQYVDITSTVFAVVSQAAADGTLLRVERVVPAAGSFTIYGTANATATTIIDWSVLNNLSTQVTN